MERIGECSERDYVYLRALVLAESANVIAPSRNAQFGMKLGPVLENAGAATLKEFVDMLQTEREPRLHRAVAEAMTINETSFFRDARSWELLRERILPELIGRRRGERKLRIWSAACSTGQESYSLAMTLCEHFPELSRWDVKIVGTDLSQQTVESAEHGRYRLLDVNRGLPVRMLVKYFVRDEEEWEVSARLRELCEFECRNLCEPLDDLPVFDLVLLRNVLLYFPQQDRERVFESVYRRMRPEGCLMLGAAEQAEDSTKLFRAEFARESYFYRPVAGS